MIEIEMPGDIKEFEAKVIGSLTLRQTICFGIAGVLGFISMQFLNNVFTTIIIAIIPVLCGVWKPYEMGLEKFALMLLLTYWLPPTNRKYIISNEYSECINKTNEDEEKQKILRSRKKKQQNRKSQNVEIMDFK